MFSCMPVSVSLCPSSSRPSDLLFHAPRVLAMHPSLRSGLHASLLSGMSSRAGQSGQSGRSGAKGRRKKDLPLESNETISRNGKGQTECDRSTCTSGTSSWRAISRKGKRSLSDAVSKKTSDVSVTGHTYSYTRVTNSRAKLESRGFSLSANTGRRQKPDLPVILGFGDVSEKEIAFQTRDSLCPDTYSLRQRNVLLFSQSSCDTNAETIGSRLSSVQTDVLQTP